MRSRQQTGVATSENRSWQMQPCSHQPTFDLCGAWRPSLQLEQLHVKNERGVWRDDSGVACRSVSHVWCAGEFRPLAEAHLRHRRKDEHVWIDSQRNQNGKQVKRNTDSNVSPFIVIIVIGKCYIHINTIISEYAFVLFLVVWEKKPKNQTKMTCNFYIYKPEPLGF